MRRYETNDVDVVWKVCTVHISVCAMLKGADHSRALVRNLCHLPTHPETLGAVGITIPRDILLPVQILSPYNFYTMLSISQSYCFHNCSFYPRKFMNINSKVKYTLLCLEIYEDEAYKEMLDATKMEVGGINEREKKNYIRLEHCSLKPCRVDAQLRPWSL